MAEMKPNSKLVFNYVKEHAGEDYTANDIAAALNIPAKSVNGILTAFQKKGFIVREPAEAELADGTHKAIKLVRVTEAGLAFDVDAQ